MSTRGTPEVSAVAEVVVVEVTARRRGRPVGRRGLAALALALAISLATAVWLGDREVRTPRVNALAHDRGEAGVAAAYGYPLRCLAVSILTADPTYARADFNHGRPCGRYTGFPTAIFRYRSGTWRKVLDAVAYACPVKSLPTLVQTQLGVCE